MSDATGKTCRTQNSDFVGSSPTSSTKATGGTVQFGSSGERHKVLGAPSEEPFDSDSVVAARLLAPLFCKLISTMFYQRK